jgi:hypothetical protein
VLQVAGVDPDAVAAHLRNAAVGVAVVHEPLDAVDRHGPVLQRLPADDAEHAVGAQAAVGVAERRDAARGEVEGAVGIGEHHEIVLGAMALAELHPISLPAT